MSYKCQSPILFLVFNRPDVTAQVFEAIRAAKPSKLYVASDGARAAKEGESEIVETVRQIATNVDWDCEVKTLFRETNLGCKEAVNSGITWFFENVEAGMILEDDTVPDLSFFPYCEELLIKYASDDRIGMISGNNHLPEYKVTDASYLFSKFKWTWGWATWRRVWVNQDVNLKFRSSPQAMSIVQNMGYRPRSERLWLMNIRKLEMETVHTWDFQWFLAMGAQNQLCITPQYNLVANIGFGVAGATHCVGSASSRYLDTRSIEFPLKHPGYVVPDYSHEAVYESILIGDGRGFGRLIPKRFRSFVRRLFLRVNKGFRLS
ncbi:MAG: hypothetical protein P8R37_11705 [Opitutae bacterium]|nr:hypothetical protein [Opitutae bacterium]